MLTKHDLPDLIVEALNAKNGTAKITDVCKFVWKNHKEQLESSGNLFFTWQYDIRWGATELRQIGKMKSTKLSPKGLWELS